jgi:two-component system response regulator AtoC
MSSDTGRLADWEEFGVTAPLHERLVGQSKFIRELDSLITQLGPTDMTVLISGESGTGKDIVARLLHQRSNRKGRPFVKVNCPAIPSELVESELFGYEKGAFTGAHTAKPGRFELAEKGTIFLDEVTEILEASQVKLFTALDGEPYMRIGGVNPIQPNVRIVSATNVPIEEALESGRIRRDVYSRLSEFVIHMLPLRERREDIPVLAEHFNYNFSKKMDKEYEPIADDVLERMQELDWRGNIRALAARVKEYVASGSEAALLDDSGPQLAERPAAREAAAPAQEEGRKFTSLKEATRIAVELTERALIEEALRFTLWNRRKAAKLLDISYSSLLRRIDAYAIGQESSSKAAAKSPMPVPVAFAD